MNSFRMFTSSLCFWIVRTAIIDTVVIRKPNETCGTVTIKGPTVLGRDIHITFNPTYGQYGGKATVYLEHTNAYFDQMAKHGNRYSYTLKRGTYKTITRCFVRYTVLQNDCDTLYFQDVKLMNLRDCGLLYMYRRGHIMVGDTVELRYMPADAIVFTPRTYVRKWILRPLGGNQTQDIKIDNHGIIEEQASFNNESVLRLRNITMAMSGGISVQCTENRSENKMTDEIKILVIGKPIFIEPPTGTFAGCSDCLYGYLGQNVTFTCGINTPSQPLHVIISIGSTRHDATEHRSGEFAINIHLQEDNHLQNVTCTVTIPTHYLIVQSKRLFVITAKSTVGAVGHGALIGALVTVLAAVVIILVIGCVCWKRRKQRDEQNTVDVHRNNDVRPLPAQNSDDMGAARVIGHCPTASIIPRSKRPQNQQADISLLAPENDCVYAVVNKKCKSITNSLAQTQPTATEPVVNYAELEIQTFPTDHQSQHATVSSATGATEYTSIDFSRTYNLA